MQGCNQRGVARRRVIQNPTPENQEEFITLRNRTNKTIRREKRNAEKEFVSSIEKHRLNLRTFFKKCNSIKKDFNTQLTMLREDCGPLITDEANIINKFRTHFKDLNINQDLSRHLWRDNDICKQVLMDRIDGRRPRGHRWMDTLKLDLA